VDDAEIERENRRWVRDIADAGRQRETACSELYRLLLRIAKSEARRRAPLLKVNGPELDDIAHQAAADALMAIIECLDRFRGEAGFTTWTSKFVIFNVSTKMNRLFWCRHEIPYEEEDWSKAASRFDVGPEDQAQVREFTAAVSSAVEENLSARQRRVFVATVLNGMPIDGLADELGSTHNALYLAEWLFDEATRAMPVVSAGLMPQGRWQVCCVPCHPAHNRTMWTSYAVHLGAGLLPAESAGKAGQRRRAVASCPHSLEQMAVTTARDGGSASDVLSFRPGWTDSRMDYIVHRVVPSVDTDMPDLLSLRCVDGGRFQ
jgi:RNA polymerase sigma factor (sigma-70 family)